MLQMVGETLRRTSDRKCPETYVLNPYVKITIRIISCVKWGRYIIFTQCHVNRLTKGIPRRYTMSNLINANNLLIVNTYM